jgi:hypothetical protein
MRFAYADPPYYGCARYYAKHHPDAKVWDSLETHAALIETLCEDYPDGWALSLHVPSLRHILPLCPADVRVMAWVKPFASWKPGVDPAYAWEPIIVRGGRKRSRQQRTMRDWVSCNITLKRGLVGAKPEGVCFWLFEVLNLEPGDEFHDLFPGSGAVTAAWQKWRIDEMRWPIVEPLAPQLESEGVSRETPIKRAA